MPAALAFGDLHRTGAELAERGARLAGGLYATGLRECDVLAVLLKNDPAYADVIQACRIAGIYYCPLNWHFAPAELDHVIRDSGAKALIGHADLLHAARTVWPDDALILSVGAPCDGALDYETWLAAEAPYNGPVVPPRAHMGYTSGTTGKPKGVRRFPAPPERAAEMAAQLRQVVAATFGTVPGCRALVSAPLYHSAPSSFAQHALNLGELLAIAPRFEAEETLALIERHRIDTVYLVPVMYVRLLRLPEAVRKQYDLTSLHFVASTGAPCAPEVKRAMIDWLGPVITETYASTESGMITACSTADALARPGTAGRPVPPAEIRILDEQGAELPTGVIGTVHVRQPAYADFTYHGRDADRAAIGRDGFITLGDMGYLDAEGYLFLCDRASDMVVSGGVNIYPAEIEHALLRIPGILDAAVFGIPDEEYGERLHAMVHPDTDVLLSPESIQAALRGLIAGYKIPRGIDIVAALPRDPNGKIAKRRLREKFWAGRTRRIG